MKTDIIVVYVQRYEHGHEKNFAPPITGIHLAAITPAQHEVRVIHQQVEQPDLETSADVVALSFFNGYNVTIQPMHAQQAESRVAVAE